MAEDKTFRYGLIVLGFFLVMVGMFIMSVDKPQIYITFCTLGILIIVVGVTWSMCQCYPKAGSPELSPYRHQQWGTNGQGALIRVVSVDTELEKSLLKKPTASSIEKEIPEKNSSQTPYTSPKEAEVYEKSLPSYEQIQMKVVGAAECLGVQSAPVLPVRAGGCTQPVVEAKAEVHRNSEKDGDAHNDEASQEKVTKLYCQSKQFHSQAPLASFPEDIDTSSVESTSNSPFLHRFKDAPDLLSSPESQLNFKLPSNEDFALIDSLTGELWGHCDEKKMAQNQDSVSTMGTGCAGATHLKSELLESKVTQNMKEDDMYYGIKEGPEESPSLDD